MFLFKGLFKGDQQAIQAADQLMAMRDFSGAIELYTKALELNPQHGEAYLKRGIAYGKAQQHAKATLDFSQLIALEPTNIDGYFNRSLSYCHQREWAMALMDADQMVRLNPNSGMAYLQRGSVEHGLDHFEQAIQDYTFTIQLGERHVVAYINRGECYFMLGNYAKALTNFETAQGIDPNFKHVLPDLAITHYQLGKVEEAKTLWNQVLQKYPELRDPERMKDDLFWRPVQIETAQAIMKGL